MNKKVIVIAAHPDDEIIGAGGTILKHIQAGDEVHWLIATNVFEHQGFTKQRVESRQVEIETVAKEVGFFVTHKLDYPTMTLTDESLLTLIPKISNIFNAVQPEIIYVLNRSDAHSDHRILFQAVLSCTKSFRYPYIKKVLMYECISETEFGPSLAENVFLPNYFVDISEFIEAKCELMKIYESEIAEPPFPRSLENIKALAHFRGASCGVKYAEAFQTLKIIDK
jgi:N-acetylglucosamine malate deacetylase 1